MFLNSVTVVWFYLEKLQILIAMYIVLMNRKGSFWNVTCVCVHVWDFWMVQGIILKLGTYNFYILYKWCMWMKPVKCTIYLHMKKSNNLLIHSERASVNCTIKNNYSMCRYSLENNLGVRFYKYSNLQLSCS
jgi:hypothetical protein